MATDILPNRENEIMSIFNMKSTANGGSGFAMMKR